MPSEMIERVYNAKDLDEQENAYDSWASQYEKDLCAMGYRGPQVGAATFARFVEIGTGPILDAGCGGGLQSEPLATLGYGPLIGIDLSEGMLSVAREKKIYKELHKMALGNGLDFPEDYFSAIISVGTITQNHAPPSSFQDLVNVAKPGASIIIVLRCDDGIDPDYWNACEELEKLGRWTRCFSSAEFLTMPYSEPDVICRAHMFKVL